MARRTSTEILAKNVQEAMTHSGVTAETLSKATALPLPLLRSRLSGASAFTLGEAAKVGGFFRVPVSVLARGEK